MAVEAMSPRFRLLGWDCEQQTVQISSVAEDSGKHLRGTSGQQQQRHQGGSGRRTSDDLKYAEADQEFSYLPAEER